MDLDKVDLNKIRTFLVICEAGSVSRAAQRLALTRSAVSHSLCTLEDELGVALFHRVGKSLVLSTQGHVLERAARDLRERLGIAIDELVGIEREVRGTVRLGLFLGFSRFQLAEITWAFTLAHPKASVRVAYGPRAWLFEQLLGGKLDMVLSLLPTGEEASRIASEELSARPLVLAITKSKQRLPRDFEQLTKLDIIDYYQSDPVIDRWTRHHFAGRKVPRERIRIFAASTDLALELVLRGAGAAVLPEDIARPFQKEKTLSVIPGRRAPLLDPVWLNELRGTRRTRAVEEFRTLLLSTLSTSSEPRSRD